MTANTYKWKNEIGILLCLLGIPISSVINEYLKGRNITNIVLLFSLLFIFNGNRIDKAKRNNDLLILYLFQIYVIVIALLSEQPLFEEAQGLIYTLFMIAIISIGCTQNKLDDPKHFINTIWWILGLSNFLLFGLVTQGFSVFDIQGRVRLAYGADRVTLSKLGFSFLIIELLRGENRKRNGLDIIFTLITFYNILYCNRRSTIVYFLIIYILHYIYYKQVWKNVQKNSQRQITGMISKIFAVTIIAVFVVFLIPNFRIRIIYYFDSILNAMNTIIGNADTDPSAQVRNELRRQTMEGFGNNTSLLQLLIGRGYMDNYLDFPFLQAFVDMGIIGIVYVVLQAILPIKYWLNRKTNVAERFFQYYSLMYFFDNFFAGIPYGYGKFVPLYFLFTQVSLQN